jgi:hypothetical protein
MDLLPTFLPITGSAPTPGTDTLADAPTPTARGPTASATTTFPSICDLLVVRGWGKFNSHRWGLFETAFYAHGVHSDTGKFQLFERLHES